MALASALSRPLSFAALLTPHGRGAVATVAFEGDLRSLDSAGLFHAANGRPLNRQPIDRIVFGHWGEAPPEEVVVCRTAVDRIEINCHGGEAASERILSRLELIGVTRLPWRACIERREGAFAADIAEALAAAATPRTAAIIARQSAGPLRAALEQLTSADWNRDRDKLLAQLDDLLRWARFGSHLTRPWTVVLYGEPNVGKSSLINALVGFERAIVFDRPGTTRDVVTAETAIDGWPVRLSDTAGLRMGAEELESAGILRAQAAVAEADLRVLVIDGSRTADQTSAWNKASFEPHLIVLNKSDLPQVYDAELPERPMIAVSAKTGEGIHDLMSRMAATLAPAVPSDDEAVPVSERQVEAIKVARTAIERDDHESFTGTLKTIAPGVVSR